MKKILLYFFIVIGIVSCSNESDIGYLDNDIKNKRIENVLETKKEDILLFMNKVLPTMPKLSISPDLEQSSQNWGLKSFESENVLQKEIEDVVPVTQNGKLLYWVVNFKNNNGYVLLAPDKTKFPIVGFKDEGSISTIL